MLILINIRMKIGGGGAGAVGRCYGSTGQAAIAAGRNIYST